MYPRKQHVVQLENSSLTETSTLTAALVRDLCSCGWEQMCPPSAMSLQPHLDNGNQPALLHIEGKVNVDIGSSLIG